MTVEAENVLQTTLVKSERGGEMTAEAENKLQKTLDKSERKGNVTSEAENMLQKTLVKSESEGEMTAEAENGLQKALVRSESEGEMTAQAESIKLQKCRDSKHLLYLHLICSLALNLVLFASLFLRRERVLTWSREAAAEAEAVVKVSCSGHGRAFLDGELSDDGSLLCDCNSCYAGADCSEFLPDCAVDVDSGDPLFMEPFWMKRPGRSAIMTTSWHRMSYDFEHGSQKSTRLERTVRDLHKVVGNAVTDGRYIVFGHGSTQLFTAAIHALSSPPSSHASPAKVVAAFPFYEEFQRQTELFQSGDFEWQGDANSWINQSKSPDTMFVEFVTTPNNPDGQLNKAVLEGSNTTRIHDHAYYWPHFTAINGPEDEDVMLFTMSKLTGHAGSRFGWAIVKDKVVYERMMDYVYLNTLSVSHDTQLRALRVLSTALEKNGSEFFKFGYDTMRFRWLRLKRIISSSKRFTLQELSPHYCKYFQRVTGPSPAYAWVRCEREEDIDCAAVMAEAGVIGGQGIRFGADRRYVRFSLIRAQDNLNLLESKLQALVSQESRSTCMAV